MSIICHGEKINNYFDIIIVPYCAGTFHFREWFYVDWSVMIII